MDIIDSPMRRGIVYVLSNPSMPGFVKIGITDDKDVKQRMAQLYTTGVPLPFKCEYAAIVQNTAMIEKAFHTAFGPSRPNPRREFFEIDPGQAIAIIKLLEIENVTPQVEREAEVVDQVDREAGEAYAAKKRPRMNFQQMGIPIGAELVSNNNGETVIVRSDRTVEFRGNETSITNATRIILDNSYNVAPSPYWTYNGRKLKDIYDETYTREDL